MSVLQGAGNVDQIVQGLIFGGGGGGTDFDKLQYDRAVATTIAHQFYTWLDITGGGLFLGVFISQSSGGATWAVQVDGGAIYQYLSGGAGGLSIQLQRFNSSLKVTANTTTGTQRSALALLD